MNILALAITGIVCRIIRNLPGIDKSAVRQTERPEFDDP
jgi:hypothetical protein